MIIRKWHQQFICVCAALFVLAIRPLTVQAQLTTPDLAEPDIVNIAYAPAMPEDSRGHLLDLFNFVF